VKAVRPAAPGHQAPGKLVDDDDFTILDHVLNVLLIERVRFDSSLDVMLQGPVFWIGDVTDAEQLFYFFPTFIGDGDVAVLLVDNKILGVDLGLPGLRIDFFALFELGNDAIDLVILVGRLFAGARNDERGAGFVNQDGIHLVDDAEVMDTLHAIAQVA